MEASDQIHEPESFLRDISTPHPTPPPINCESGWDPETNRKISERENSLMLAVNSIFIQICTFIQILKVLFTKPLTQQPLFEQARRVNSCQFIKDQLRYKIVNCLEIRSKPLKYIGGQYFQEKETRSKVHVVQSFIKFCSNRKLTKERHN